MLPIKDLPSLTITQTLQTEGVNPAIMEEHIHRQVTVQQRQVLTVALETSNHDIRDGPQLLERQLITYKKTVIKRLRNHPSQTLKYPFKRLKYLPPTIRTHPVTQDLSTCT